MVSNALRWLQIAILLLSAWSDLFPADAPGQNPLRFTTPVQRMTVSIGSRAAELRFPFVNTGVTPITIEAISASCPCLQVMSGIGTYAPDANGCVVVSMEVSGQEPTQRGLIHVTAGAAGSSSTDLTAIVEVPPLLTCNPNVLQWAQTPDGAAKAAETKTMTATIAPGSDFEISAIRLVSPRFTCVSVIAEDRRTAVVKVAPDGSGKVAAGTVDVTITSRKAPTEERILHAYVVIYGK